MAKKKQKVNALTLGYVGAVFGAVGMLVLGIFGNAGIYLGAVEMMRQWHMFFNISILGIITGMIEAALWSFVGLYFLGWLYNKLS